MEATEESLEDDSDIKEVLRTKMTRWEKRVLPSSGEQVVHELLAEQEHPPVQLLFLPPAHTLPSLTSLALQSRQCPVLSKVSCLTIIVETDISIDKYHQLSFMTKITSQIYEKCSKEIC